MPRKEEVSLTFKILDHIFVPKHEILSKEDAKATLKLYSSRPDQLPYILATDPAAKEIGAKAGDIVKITRSSETAGESLYYRLVIEG